MRNLQIQRDILKGYAYVCFSMGVFGVVRNCTHIPVVHNRPLICVHKQIIFHV